MKLAQLIEDYILRPREPRGYKQVKRYKPSSFGQCFRRQWYKKNRFEPTNPPSDYTKEIFVQGSLCEDIYVKRYPEADLQYKVEVPGFLGYADLKFDDRIEEVKSVSGAVYNKVIKPGYDIWKEKLHNVLQLGYYMVDAGVGGSLVYISRDSIYIDSFIYKDRLLCFQCSGDVKVYNIPIPLDARLIKAVGDEMKMLRSLRECPRAEPRMENECGQCDYYERCLKETGKKGGDLCCTSRETFW